MSETVHAVRRAFTAGDDQRDAGLTTPENIPRWDDIPYGTDPDWQRLDVYRPKSAGDADLPVIVSVHGGGWVNGDRRGTSTAAWTWPGGASPWRTLPTGWHRNFSFLPPWRTPARRFTGC